jgi:hypothetical protein
MPRNCDVISYNIVKVLDERGSLVSDLIWKNKFTIDNKGLFEVIDTKEIINHM